MAEEPDPRIPWRVQARVSAGGEALAAPGLFLFLMPGDIHFLAGAAFLAAVAGAAWYAGRRNRRERSYRASLAELTCMNDRLYRENNRLNYDMIVLYQFVNNLANCRSSNAVNQEFISTVQQSIDPEVSALFLTASVDGALVLAAHHGLDELAADDPRFQAGAGLVGWVAANRREILLEETSAEPRFPELRQKPFAPHFRTAIGLPLLCQERLLGVTIIGRSAGVFSQDELRLLFIIANEAALYLQNLRLYEEVARMAITDGPTDLYNHRYFFDQIDLELNRAQAHGSKLSLLMIDIDRFKPFNDIYGHLTGDAILKQVADQIQATVPPEALVARYGGEEFAVLMPDTDLVRAYAVAEAVRQRISEQEFATADGRTARVTVSIGLATYPDHTGGNGNPVTDLIAAADYQLVAHAKEGGRNRVCHPGGLDAGDVPVRGRV